MQPSLMNRLDTALRLAMSTLDQVSQRLLVILNDDNAHAIGAILANAEQHHRQPGRAERRGWTARSATSNAWQRPAPRPARRCRSWRRASRRCSTQTEQLLDDAAQHRRAGRQPPPATAAASSNTPAACCCRRSSGWWTIWARAADSLRDLGERLNANPQMLLLGPPQREPGPGRMMKASDRCWR